MIELLAISRKFNVRPSSMIAGLTTYEAYCFDAACLVYVLKLDEGKKPIKHYDDATQFL